VSKDNRIDKLSKCEVRYQIPVELLGFLGSREVVDTFIDGVLKKLREATLPTIPRSLETKVTRYVVSCVRDRIYQKYQEDETDWMPSQPLHLELIREYKEEEVNASNILDTLIKVSVMHRSASDQQYIRASLSSKD